MQPKDFFKDEGLVAFISDAAIDFTPADFEGPLSLAQQKYLKENTGIDIPKVFWRKQVHGDIILDAQGGASASQGCPDADAYITDEKKLPIAIRTADCVPVFLFDPIGRVIGLAHAGWKGTHRNIAFKTAEHMKQKYTSDTVVLKAYLGPSIRSCCYQVGEEFKTHFPSCVTERKGHLYLDLIHANRDQLLKAGIRKENIFDSNACTCCNRDYFSFRRDGSKAGRMISLMMLL